MSPQLQFGRQADTSTSGASQEALGVSKQDRIPSTLRICHAGLPFLAIAAIVLTLGVVLLSPWTALLTAPITLWVAWFFRDPPRSAQVLPHQVLSPADGRVIVVEETHYPRLLSGPCLKISVFMSVFNVHVNRSPIKGRVTQVSYNPGKFLAAYVEKASLDNEQNAVVIENDRGQSILFIQIAGLIARRILCRVSQGEQLDVGEKYGLIRFGSRMDIYLPQGSKSLVKPGQNVQGGKTLLAEI